MKRTTAWKETVMIPTYGVGDPNPNPMFLEKRVYQGSSGVVYPHAVIDKIHDEKADRPYEAVFLENEYLKVMLLPELGGRVHYAYDKTNGYAFVYHNEVIKPALVGLTGPWISGGIEFNWPQHHRPSTFEPTDVRIEENADGSATVWIGEIERMFRTKALVGFSLYPGKAYLELDVRLYNRTSEPQTFLWWANPAVAVNDDYQSVFPPDVHAVMDHGKRDVSAFPIATGTYYKVNYAPGTDISRYKNIPVPTSYMAYHSDFDFVGCYDHGPQAGMMHVANHHVVPGKKQWTWGHGDFGRAWDRHLTDENGPYIELMCGAYTDNQPDFSWLMPGEEKRFQQYFMPYKAIGPACNARKEGALSLRLLEGRARIGVYLTSAEKVRVTLRCEGRAVFEKEVSLSPETSLVEDVEVPRGVSPQAFSLEAVSPRLRLSFTPLGEEKRPIPDPAVPARAPEAIESNEELYLNGLHLEQYRHATYAPEPYYEEALRRDPGDSRCNNAMGLLLLRRGRFADAEPFFRRAIKRQTLRNPNPYDGEAYYNLGRSLVFQERFDEAFDAFYKSVWNDAWQGAGYFELARLAARRGDNVEALELVGRSLEKGFRHHKARHLKIQLLRRLGRSEEAGKECEIALELDPLEFGALREQQLLGTENDFVPLMRGYIHNYLELALDYAHGGAFKEAIDLLEQAPDADPMRGYYLGWIASRAGDDGLAREAFLAASKRSAAFGFPHRLECVLALEAAMRANEHDAKAPYLLGNFCYSRRRSAEAIACWERSVELDATFPTAWRNLGLAYMNKLEKPEKALAALRRAHELDPQDSRVLFELDQLCKKAGGTLKERLDFLRAREAVVFDRDDLTIEYITLQNLMGEHQKALEILRGRTFHPWEGGEGKVTGQYVCALVELARSALESGAAAAAVKWLQQARTYPANLGEGKLTGARENQILYYYSLAQRVAGDEEASHAALEEASSGLAEPTSARYYNDQPPESIFYQGLALRQLGREAEAVAVFQKLIDYGSKHLNDAVGFDYFAVSLPDFLVFDEDLQAQNRAHCLFMRGLGELGLGRHAEAEKCFEQTLALYPFHQGAILHKRLSLAEVGS